VYLHYPLFPFRDVLFEVTLHRMLSSIVAAGKYTGDHLSEFIMAYHPNSTHSKRIEQGD
jgi:hypothetical protein